MKKKKVICYRISKSIIDWLPHADNGCETLYITHYTMNKKGKRKKTKKNENLDDQNPQVFGTSFLYHNAVTTLWGKKTCQQWLPSIKICANAFAAFAKN